MGASRNKVLLEVAGRSILRRSLDAFEESASISRIVVVVAERDRAACMAEIASGAYAKVQGVIEGGDSRHASEYLGLLALADDVAAGTLDVALVHDAARPFVTSAEIDALVTEARHSGASILAVPPTEELVVLGPDGRLAPAPGDLWLAQTPQAFAGTLAVDAHRRAAADGFVGTDTAAVVERVGAPIAVIEGRPENIKITSPEDLLRAAVIARGQPAR
jgi:2-C-methyl-D-erythritol 4-phosphate cytidylyltransferase